MQALTVAPGVPNLARRDDASALERQRNGIKLVIDFAL